MFLGLTPPHPKELLHNGREDPGLVFGNEESKEDINSTQGRERECVHKLYSCKKKPTNSLEIICEKFTNNKQQKKTHSKDIIGTVLRY